jgi:alpha-glucosidase (family GH31 glycosyl hydrolase)
MDALQDGGTPLVVTERHASGQHERVDTVLDNAHGVSIYLPRTSGGVDYSQYVGGELYNFTGEAEWDEFVESYVALTGLPPRPPDDRMNPQRMLNPSYVVSLPFVVR